jgi:nitrogen fixation protein FixH
VHIAPPVEVAAAAGAGAQVPSPGLSRITAAGSDPATSVKVRLAVSRGTAGLDTFYATVTDYKTGAPVRADGVTLRFADPARSDLDASRLGLTVAGTGVFAATGRNLSLEGSWRIVAIVDHGGSSTEVPLELTAWSTRPAMAPPTP